MTFKKAILYSCTFVIYPFAAMAPHAAWAKDSTPAPADVAAQQHTQNPPGDVPQFPVKSWITPPAADWAAAYAGSHNAPKPTQIWAPHGVEKFNIGQKVQTPTDITASTDQQNVVLKRPPATQDAFKADPSVQVKIAPHTYQVASKTFVAPPAPEWTAAYAGKQAPIAQEWQTHGQEHFRIAQADTNPDALQAVKPAQFSKQKVSYTPVQDDRQHPDPQAWIKAMQSGRQTENLPENAPLKLRDEQGDLVRSVIRADTLSYDDIHKITTAQGNVEVTHGARVLHAGRITYNTVSGQIMAYDNVTVFEPDGTISRADQMEVDGGLKEGIAENMHLLLSDQSFLRAARIEYNSEGNSIMWDAIYSACNLPRESDSPPLWQIKSSRIVHNKAKQEVVYDDATLELYGTPIFYTPYLKHPDPTVKRRSGILPPSIHSNKTLGTSIHLPYYLVLDDHSDLTLTPMLFSQDYPGLAAEYRQLFMNGSIRMDGSTLYARKDEKQKGHLRGEIDYNLNQTWRTGLHGGFSSDKSYLKRYSFGNPEWLETRVFAEGFWQRSNVNIETLHFQGLRDSDYSSKTPSALPRVNMHLETAPKNGEGQWLLDGGIAVIEKNEGAKSRRASMHGRWRLPYIFESGHVAEIQAALVADGFHVENQPYNGKIYDGTAGRLVPEVSAKWSLPLEKQSENFHQILEPTVMLIASPNGLNSEKIPNLDSQNFEFDETNLFSSNRFTGYDRYETGPRAIYGLKWAGYSPVYGNASATIGQTYRLHKDSAYNKTSGLAGNWSDYVLQMSIEPSKYLYLDYRGRLDRRTLLANQSEVNAWVGTQALSFGTNYILINQPLDETNEDYGDREEITAYATSHFSEFWKATISTKHDLRDHGGALENKIQLDYENECCILSTAIKRDYTTDDDVDNDYSAYITFTLKTLGQIKSGSN